MKKKVCFDKELQVKGRRERERKKKEREREREVALTTNSSSFLTITTKKFTLKNYSRFL